MTSNEIWKRMCGGLRFRIKWPSGFNSYEYAPDLNYYDMKRIAGAGYVAMWYKAADESLKIKTKRPSKGVRL